MVFQCTTSVFPSSVFSFSSSPPMFHLLSQQMSKLMSECNFIVDDERIFHFLSPSLA